MQYEPDLINPRKRPQKSVPRRRLPPQESALLQPPQKLHRIRQNHEDRCDLPLFSALISEVPFLPDIVHKFRAGVLLRLLDPRLQAKIYLAKRSHRHRQLFHARLLEPRHQLLQIPIFPQIQHPIQDLPEPQSCPNMLINMKHQRQPVQLHWQNRKTKRLNLPKLTPRDAILERLDQLAVFLPHNPKPPMQLKADPILLIAIVMVLLILPLLQHIAVLLKHLRRLLKIILPDKKVHISSPPQSRLRIRHRRCRAFNDHTLNLLLL